MENVICIFIVIIVVLEKQPGDSLRDMEYLFN